MHKGPWENLNWRQGGRKNLDIHWYQDYNLELALDDIFSQMWCGTGSLVRPKVVRSVHYCPATKKTLERRYTDMTSYDPFPSSSIYPTKDEDGK